MMFETGVSRIADVQSALNKTMQQISANRRVLVPADDAVAAARALDVSQAQAVNQQYAANRQNAKTSLMQVEGTLQGVTSLLQAVKTAIVYAGNGSLSDIDRASIATELRGRFEELLGLANATDGSGNYLFSGHQTTTPAFSQANVGAQYQGDDGRRYLQVDAARTMEISDSGKTIFQGGSTGPDVFKTVDVLIKFLQKDPTVTNITDNSTIPPTVTPIPLADALATANGNIDKALDNVGTVRASVGARLNEIDALDDTGSARDIQYEQNLSDLIGLDPVEAYSRLTQQQITLQAAQKAYVSTSGLSLFQYM
jgi:flagellar hook-associated protein 3 FlgL